MIVITVPIIYNIIIIGIYVNIISNTLKVVQYYRLRLRHSAAYFHLNFYFLTRIILYRYISRKFFAGRIIFIH